MNDAPLPPKIERTLADRLEAVRRDHLVKAKWRSERGEYTKAAFHYDAASALAEAIPKVR